MPTVPRLGYEDAGNGRFGDAAIQTSIPSAPPPPAVPVRRLAVIDLARGVALLSMALYHLTWDLGFLRLTPENAALSPIGRAAAHGIAGSFLVLVGVSLVLARGRTSQVRSGTGFRSALATIPRSGWQFSRLAFGLVRPEGRHAGWWSAYIARLGRIALAAAVISLATFFLFPDSWIFFGILHCIALSSVLALPALVAPLPLVGLAAALVFAGPTLVGLACAPAGLDAPGLFFLGHFQDKADRQQAVARLRAGDLDVIRQAEGALESAGRDAAVQVRP